MVFDVGATQLVNNLLVLWICADEKYGVEVRELNLAMTSCASVNQAITMKCLRLCGWRL